MITAADSQGDSGSPGPREGPRIRVGTRTLLLDHSGAAIDQGSGRLFVADLHLGKGGTLRRAGVPIPAGTSRETMERISRTVARVGGSIREVWVLGDLVHAAAGLDESLVGEVAEWIAGLPGGGLHLVRGNHDRSAGRMPAEWHLEAHDEPHLLDGLYAAHIPPEPGRPDPSVDDRAMLAGHLHPMVRAGRGRTRTRKMPAFVGWGGAMDRPRVLVLPAQGRMVDGAVIRGRPGLYAWVCTEGEVVALAEGAW